MRKNIEPRKDKKGKVKDGFHQIGQVCVDSGQIAIADPCNMGDEPDTIVSTNFGDGIFPIFEYWENNKRLDLCIPLSTELHNALREGIEGGSNE